MGSKFVGLLVQKLVRATRWVAIHAELAVIAWVGMVSLKFLTKQAEEYEKREDAHNRFCANARQIGRGK